MNFKHLKAMSPILIIVIIGAILRIFDIASQPPLPDEVGLAYSSISYWDHGYPGYVMWWHPRINDMLVYLGGKIFGFTAWGIRWHSLLAGISAIYLTYYLSTLVTENKSASYLAAFFIATDPAHIFVSRLPLQESLVTALLSLSIICFAIYLKKGSIWYAFISGMIIGISLGVKLYALPVIAVFILIILMRSKGERFSAVLQGSVNFIMLPFAVYIFSYYHWFARGHSFAEWLQLQQYLISQIMNYAGNANSNFLPHKAYEWFTRPSIYASFTFNEDRGYVVAALSNPFIWLLILPATIYIIYKIASDRHFSNRTLWMLLSATFFAIYATFLTTARPVWLFSAIPLLPIAYTLLAFCLVHAINRMKRFGCSNLIYIYLVIAIFMNLALYPISIGKGLNYGYSTYLLNKYVPSNYYLK